MNETNIPEKALELAHAAELLTASHWPAITCQTEYEQAAAARKEAKAKERQLLEEQAGMIDPLNTAKNKIWAFFKPPLTAIKQFVADIDRPMVAYVKAEKIKAEAEAEKKRIADQKEAEDERAALAAMMDDIGETQLAMDVIATPVTVAPVEVAKTKAFGTSSRVGVDVVIDDKMALLAAIVAGTVDHRCADINMAEVRRWVMVWGSAPPGVTVSEKITIVNR
jgi:hypothetical protein